MVAHTEWKIAADPRSQVRELAQQLELHPAVARVLLLRGATTVAEARRFLNPALENLCDPFSLTDMAKAVKRIQAARSNSERILVFGDYDVDGIAGAALMVLALRRFGLGNCLYAMPNRLVEGYGLSPDRVEWAHAQGITLIVTVDNGIAAHAAIDRARAFGIDVIITDHHQIEHAYPDAFAVINPKREAPDHPAANICGAGVAMKLAHALTGEIHDIDLAALGTIADVVPLVGENRDIVAAGLQTIAKSPRIGIEALANISNIATHALRSDDVAFQLAPRINAGGRMADGLAGLDLLLTDSREEARVLAEELNAANEERKTIESETLAEALSTLKTSFVQDQRTIVLASRAWHRGVIGIVASRIQAHYYRPAILIALDSDGVGRGSARSITGFNIASAIDTCKEFLEASGGHAMAAGLTIKEENVAAFQKAFESCAQSLLPTGEIARVINIDAQVALTDMDSQLVRSLERLQPFGQANPAPVFCTFGAHAVQDSWRELKGAHLKLMVKEGPKILDVIGFRMAERRAALMTADSIDIAFTPQLNTWRGETTVQLVAKDIRAART